MCIRDRNTCVPGHFNLNQVSEYVKNGIYRGGGTPVEFGVIAACDGVAQGHLGMHYILPSREIICNSVEIQVQAHKLDAIVMLASCDKIVPAMLMAAARLDIPAIIVNSGPMLGGVEFDGRKTDMTSVDEAMGMMSAGKISKEEFGKLENLVGPGCGSCSFLGTANTMCCVTEGMGMSLPGSALAVSYTHLGENYIASDIPALLNYTRKIYFLEDDEIALIRKDSITILDKNRNEIKRDVFNVTWDISAAEKDGYDHFMIKEIHEQPKIVKETVERRIQVFVFLFFKSVF